MQRDQEAGSQRVLKGRLVGFLESMWYRPRLYHRAVSAILLPLSLLYGALAYVRRVVTKRVDPGIAVVSIGNLVVGGSGKTPMIMTLASHFEDVAVVLRGYGRQSEGLVVVSRRGKIMCDVKASGDEAMEIAKTLPKASVIVDANRMRAIARAKALGAKAVFLDDGFSKVGIKKFEILLEPKHLPNTLPLPSGPFREFAIAKRFADCVLKEGRDFERIVQIDPEAESKRLLLVSAIANPVRLEPYLPKGVVGRYLLPDHTYFDKVSIEKAMVESGAEAILVTPKDFVKLEHFKLPTYQMRLQLRLFKEVEKEIKAYLKGYRDE